MTRKGYRKSGDVIQTIQGVNTLTEFWVSSFVGKAEADVLNSLLKGVVQKQLRGI